MKGLASMPMEDEEEESGDFYSEVFAALKEGDKAGFKAALKAAIEECMAEE